MKTLYLLLIAVNICKNTKTAFLKTKTTLPVSCLPFDTQRDMPCPQLWDGSPFKELLDPGVIRKMKLEECHLSRMTKASGVYNSQLANSWFYL